MWHSIQWMQNWLEAAYSARHLCVNKDVIDMRIREYEAKLADMLSWD